MADSPSVLSQKAQFTRIWVVLLSNSRPPTPGFHKITSVCNCNGSNGTCASVLLIYRAGASPPVLVSAGLDPGGPGRKGVSASKGSHVREEKGVLSQPHRLSCFKRAGVPEKGRAAGKAGQATTDRPPLTPQEAFGVVKSPRLGTPSVEFQEQPSFVFSLFVFHARS